MPAPTPVPATHRARRPSATAGRKSEIVTEVNDLNLAYSKGHEIGTHYNGHFCDDNLPGGNQWNTADWNNELDQFFNFMTDWKTLNGYTDAPDLKVPVDSIKGGRTPCLTGKLDDADSGVEGAQHDLRLVDAGAARTASTGRRRSTGSGSSTCRRSTHRASTA